MSTEIIQIENLKCGGCANTTKTNLEKINSLKEVNVDIDKSEVQVSSDRTIDRAEVVSVLARLGYPELGQGNTLQKVKSYVSCAVGKINS